MGCQAFGVSIRPACAGALHLSNGPPRLCSHAQPFFPRPQKVVTLLWGGGGSGSGGSSCGGGGGGQWGGDGEGTSWRWSWLALSLVTAFAQARPSLALVAADTSTRQTYVGEVAAKYAQMLQEACKEHGYQFYDSPYQLNIVGVRKPSDEAGAFDDHFAVVFSTREDGGKACDWVMTTYTASVDPGRAWLTMGWGGAGGTAILCPGQYVEAYEVGLHNGVYEALVQSQPVKVWRDHDKDGKLDFGDHGSFDDEGLFGVNIHHAGIKDAAEYHSLRNIYSDMVEKYSAGCQVIATIDDFTHFMQTVKMSIQKGNKPYFTYTLFEGRRTWDAMAAPLAG